MTLTNPVELITDPAERRGRNRHQHEQRAERETKPARLGHSGYFLIRPVLKTSPVFGLRFSGGAYSESRLALAEKLRASKNSPAKSRVSGKAFSMRSIVCGLSVIGR